MDADEQAPAAGPGMPDAGRVAHILNRLLVEELGRDPARATAQEWYYALAYYLRSRLLLQHLRSERQAIADGRKRIYYLSLEFLPGRILRSALRAQDPDGVCAAALRGLGVAIEDLYDREVEPALGNGGLGRLAACLVEAMATLRYPGMGYGICYEFGLFRQAFEGHRQVELPENWLRQPYPWLVPRPHLDYAVHFGGRSFAIRPAHGELEYGWADTADVTATASDLPVPGGGADTVGMIRLWSAKAGHGFDLHHFQAGNYMEAVRQTAERESISKVLYPNDMTPMGRELRLRQEYFLVAASLQDILWRHQRQWGDLRQLADRAAIQMNDTHPSLAVAELMRLLMDEHRLGWDEAWDQTVRTLAYTNHTLQSEALETWPVDMVAAILPRHLDIIYEINHRFLTEVRHRHPGESAILRRLSLIDEDNRRVRMSHLAVVGSHRVNGVSALHSGIMQESVFADLHRHFPGRFINVTNGITPRRWISEANPALAQMLTEAVGVDWQKDLAALQALRPLASDSGFVARFAAIKAANKTRLAQHVADSMALTIDPTALLDVHIKRIHEYKRQLLSLLYLVVRYNRLRHGGGAAPVPRTMIYGGKAAPGYAMAKLIIRLINDVADTVNHDPAVRDLLRIGFVPDYNVSAAELIVPAAELSEQISAVGTEACGTGNMKLGLNGALTIATRDGANVEIASAVGEDNIFMFGPDHADLAGRTSAARPPVDFVAGHAELAEAFEMIRGGHFNTDRDLYLPLLGALLADDRYMVLSDYDAYAGRQDDVDRDWRGGGWTAKAVHNVASLGTFSADRTVRDYARLVWNADART
jgi:starch phosphorylase